MPPHGKEVMLTELETLVMSVFVKKEILDDWQIANILKQLADKLEGNLENHNSR